jgi:hypothetical protein
MFPGWTIERGFSILPHASWCVQPDDAHLREEMENDVRRLCAIAMLAVLTGQGHAKTAVARVDRDHATLTLGAQASINSVHLRPVSIEQDSRCAVGAQCIWAGTVKVKARVGTAGQRASKILTLSEPMEVAKGRWITLTSVCPIPQLGRPIVSGDYRLTFRFDRGPTAPAPREAATNC